MQRRELKVLILGDVPEVDGIFERPFFEEDLPTHGMTVRDPEAFAEVLQAPENYELIVANLEPHGLQVLEQVRDYRPACPVIALLDPDEKRTLLEARRRNLADNVTRTGDPELTTDLLAESIRVALERYVQPPTMEQPSAGEMYRYSHFFNILHPFFLASRRRHLLYANRVGRELVERLHDASPDVGDAVEEWYLEGTVDDFQRQLDRAFAGYALVTRNEFPGAEGTEQLHELYYRPVVEPNGRVVAVSIAIHEPGRPQLSRARAMQAVTRFAGGVAHRMNNLLGIISTNLDLLEPGEGSSDGDRLERIRRGLERAEHLTEQMQTYSRTAVTQLDDLSVDETLEAMAPELQATVGDRADLQLELEATGATIRTDRDQFETVVTNVVENAADAVEEGAPILLRTFHRRIWDWQPDLGIGQGSYVVLQIEDDGEGIPLEHHDEIFEPFYTTRAEEEHVGLGLAIVRTVVEHTGGGVELDSAPGEGTTVRLYFPSDPARRRTVTGEGEEARPPTILLVHDASDVRESYRELLEQDGYRVLGAADAEEAMEAARTPDREVDLLVTTATLRDENGKALADALQEEVGELPVVLVSSYGDLPNPQVEQMDSTLTVLLSQPFRAEALLTAVDDLLTPNGRPR